MQTERNGAALFSWRAVWLAGGLLAVLAAGLTLGFVGTAFGAAERVLSGTTGSSTDPGPGTATAPAATTTAPPPDPAPATVKKPPPRHVAPSPPPPPRTVKKSLPASVSHEPPPPVVTPRPSRAPASAATVTPNKTAGPARQAPVVKPPVKSPAPATRPQAQLSIPIPIPHSQTVLSIQTASDFSRAPIFVTLALAIMHLRAAVVPPRAVPSPAL